MQNDQHTQSAVNEVYNYAANQMVNAKKNPKEVTDSLVEYGFDKETATIVVSNLERQISEAKKERANKDMIYGALWCIGGTVLTLAHIGFIFWGAIVFGAVQFIKGAVNSQG